MSRGSSRQCPECGRPVHARGLCHTHYNKRYRKAWLDAYRVKKNARLRKGPSQAERKRIALEKQQQTKVCEQCGVTFSRLVGRADVQWEKQQYCSRTCLNRANGGDHGRPPDHAQRIVVGRKAKDPTWGTRGQVKARLKAAKRRTRERQRLMRAHQWWLREHQRRIHRFRTVLCKLERRFRRHMHFEGRHCICDECRKERARRQRNQWKTDMWHGVDTPETDHKYFKHRAKHLLYTRHQKALKRQRDRLNKNG
jgi:hypothetical protein